MSNIKKIDIKEYIILAALLLAIFCLYIFTMFSSYKSNDSPEIIASAYTLGNAHPPGYPLYTLAGKIATYIPVGSIAFRINILSAFFAVLFLLVSYFTIKNIILKDNKEQYMAMFFVIVLAFGNLLWSQAIEGKGGIYTLNILFFSILLNFSLKAEKLINKRDIYLASYIFGLSLANHWPSMIIFTPVFVYTIIINRKKINIKNLITSLLLIFAGISPYLYLYLRNLPDTVIVWGNSHSLSGMWDIIIRKVYEGQELKTSANFFVDNLQYLIKVLLENYWILWMAGFLGIYNVYQKQRSHFIIYASVILINVVVLIAKYRTPIETIWLMGIFLIPACYVFGLLIIEGTVYLADKINNKIHKNIAAVILILFVLCMIYVNYNKNQRNNDFIAYDMTQNLLMSIDNNAVFMPETDMTFFPIIYSQNVDKRRLDIKLVPLPFLKYEWGINPAKIKLGDFPASSDELLNTLKEAANNVYKTKGTIYRDFTSNAFETVRIPFYVEYSGLVKSLTVNPPMQKPELYDMYTLRGIYDNHAKADENVEIITRYLIYMSMHAEELLSIGMNEQAIKIYKKALAIPVAKLDYNMYYKIAMGYLAMQDKDTALDYLKKAIIAKPDFLEAYESGGVIYFNRRDMENAKKWFIEAVKYGSKNEEILRYVESVVINN